jgi:thiol-disulfide isomerase/thioredoxin
MFRTVVLAAMFACAKEPAAPVGSSDRGVAAPVTFQFNSLDERPVSSQAFLGHRVVLAFVTTWDVASQGQAQLLAQLSVPQGVNKVLVALDERHNRELVEVFAKTLKISFPVAMAEPTASREGLQLFGDFGEIAVPTVVVLDESGRILLRSNGITKANEVLRALQ